jgi:hypothetical protein
MPLGVELGIEEDKARVGDPDATLLGRTLELAVLLNEAIPD